ncbi:hypothetical protein [Neisseria bacilliformis]|uniref:hypothetical protein n=1 Tax=Neisseria bacilliformis TaxID=267212 RepID=UPI0028E7C2F4|nr:hypothetical protein [Neisseria bacilliformis]
MNKLFLTLLAAALPAAAEVELYGNIRSGVEAVHSSRPSGSETTAAVRDFGSYVGIKGRIALGAQAAGISAGRPQHGFGGGSARPPYRTDARREQDGTEEGQNSMPERAGRFEFR